MSEGINSSEDNDLSAFADYLAEFESLINFDDETCSVCGINISDSISVQKSPYVLYKSLKEESELNSVIKMLDSKCIPYKIEKQLDSSSIEKIQYNYSVLIPFKCLNEIQK